MVPHLFSKIIRSQGVIMVLLLAFIGVLVIALGGVIQLVNFSTGANRRVNYARQATYLAEAGVERAIAQLNQSSGYTGETITLPNPATAGVPTIGAVAITVTNIDSSTKQIVTTGYVPSQTQPQATRQTRVRVTGISGGTPTFFNFGVQVGNIGVTMDNNSSISGNVFSNGPIRGNPGTTISGSAVSAGATGLIEDFGSGIAGNVTANTLEDSTVAGNVSGQICRHSTISGNLAANTITACTVTGTTSAGVPDTPPQPLPITQAQIDAWKSAAEAGGVQTGNLNITTNSSLGPKKILGNLTVANNVTLTLTGTVWVTGNIQLDNGSTIRLDPGYGSNDGVIIADGNIHLDNNVVALGSGQADSYLMLLSTSTGTAIDLDNNARGAIIYAANGTINIDNNGVVKQATGNGFHLGNNARLIFESGITNSNFIDVPIGSSWTFIRGTYQRIQ